MPMPMPVSSIQFQNHIILVSISISIHPVRNPLLNFALIEGRGQGLIIRQAIAPAPTPTTAASGSGSMYEAVDTPCDEGEDDKEDDDDDCDDDVFLDHGCGFLWICRRCLVGVKMVCGCRSCDEIKL